MGFYWEKPRIHRSNPLKNIKAGDEAFESVTGRLAGVNHAAQWKTLKKRTIKEMVLKAAISPEQLRHYYNQEKINKPELRAHCIKNLNFNTPEAVKVVARYGKLIF